MTAASAFATEGNRNGTSPADFGLTLGVDAGPSFSEAQDAAIRDGSMLVNVPGGTYYIQTGIKLRAGVTWRMQGSILRTASQTIDVFNADGVDDWAIIGRGSIVGSRRLSGAQQAQNGVVIRDAAGFYVEGLVVRNLAGIGFRLSGDHSVSRGDGRQFNNVSAIGCTVGRRVDAGAGGEFSTWSSWHAASNDLADSISAGNTSTIGGVIAENNAGIDLLPGPNHGHGRYVGVTIAHNKRYNVRADRIWHGFTFSDCSVYENDVHLIGSRGIWFNGGIFDARVVNDGSSEARDNGVRGAYMPGDYQPSAQVFPSDADDGTGKEKFSFIDCTGGGAS